MLAPRLRNIRLNTANTALHGMEDCRLLIGEKWCFETGDQLESRKISGL